MNPLENGQKETRQIRRTENESQYSADRIVGRGAGQDGHGTEHQSIRDSRDFCKEFPADTTAPSKRESDLGGIYRQLINDCRHQLAVKKEEVAYLESRIEVLEKAQSELELDYQS
jgi:hypothetical protein